MGVLERLAGSAYLLAIISGDNSMIAPLLFAGLFYAILSIAIILDMINIFLYIRYIVAKVIYHRTGVQKKVPSAAPVAATLFYVAFLLYGVFVNASLGKPFFPISTELKVGLLFLTGHIALHIVFIRLCWWVAGSTREVQ